MNKFSDRIGVTKPRAIIQLNLVEEESKNLLWNLLDKHYWDKGMAARVCDAPRDLQEFYKHIWNSFFKYSYDTMPFFRTELITIFRRYFFHKDWYNLYNFIEFVAGCDTSIFNRWQFITECNKVMAQELLGYRFIDSELVPITNEEELESIENLLQITDQFNPVKVHISTSIKLLSDRQNPDYRNSIKESISAVEALCCIVAKKPKASLIEAIRQMEGTVSIHPALKSAFSSLYGYTSDAGGIRHKLLEDDNLQQEDAIYMLVSCSAFINYLIKKLPD